MLAFLGVRTHARKRRLFAVACCHRVSAWMRDKRCLRALALAERLIEGPADFLTEQATRSNVEDAAEEALRRADGAADDAAFAAANSVVATLHADPDTAARNAADQAASAAFHAATADGRHAAVARAAERIAQADLVRDIFTPFRTPSLDVSLLHWNNRAIPRLAEAIYADRSFDHLPILADALEDAGCTDQVLLDHLRAPGPHVRGCWALDLILGKP